MDVILIEVLLFHAGACYVYHTVYSYNVSRTHGYDHAQTTERQCRLYDQPSTSL